MIGVHQNLELRTKYTYQTNNYYLCKKFCQYTMKIISYFLITRVYWEIIFDEKNFFFGISFVILSKTIPQSLRVLKLFVSADFNLKTNRKVSLLLFESEVEMVKFVQSFFFSYNLITRCFKKWTLFCYFNLILDIKLVWQDFY